MTVDTCERLQTYPETAKTDSVHLELCCYPNEALCGADLTGETDLAEADCATCLFLSNSGASCYQIKAVRGI